MQAAWQGEPLPAPGELHLQSLWAYLLLLHRHRPASREHLAFTFWPDVLEDTARARLRRRLHTLRRWLPPSPDGPWLWIDSNEIQLNPQAGLWVDVWAFEDGLTHGPAELEVAVNLVTGELLPHLYDDWLLLERERLHHAYARALARLITLHQMRGDWPSAIAWGRRLVAHDPLDEESHRLLMGLYYASGNRPAALQQFEHCLRVLRDELGVEPMPETLALRGAVLRGEALEVGVREAVSWPPSPEPRAPAPGEAMPFVGREAELQRLLEHWRQTVRHNGNIVLVGGEAGVGKTRLLRELAWQAQRQGGCALWGHAYAFEGHAPYQPAVEVLRAALHQLAAGHIAPVWLAEAARLLPELRERRPDLPEPARLEPEHEQARLMEGLCRCLLGLAAQQPLLVLLEDLHWAGDSTLAWLHALGRQVRQAPLLVVGSYRQEEVGHGHPLRTLVRELRREGGGAFLTLHPLAGDTTQQLVQALSGLGEDAAGVARHLHAESEGNPFFLSELIRHLEEIGQLRWWGGKWAGPWVEAGGEGALPLPETVREAIQERVERLSEAGRELLSCAAVAGREFDAAVVRGALDWREEEALESLEELMERGMVCEQAGAGVRNHSFSHHLVQEVAYAALPRLRRQSWHRRVGEAMESAYGDGAAGELAYHFEQAGAKEQALKYLKLAGDQAAGRYAYAEALEYYGRALALLPRAGAHEQLMMRFDLLVARAGLWGLLGGPQAWRADLALLEATAKALGDSLRLAHSLALWANFYNRTSDFAACIRATTSAQMLFRQAGDRHGEAQCLERLGEVAYFQGEYRTARDYHEQALALHRAVAARSQEARSLGILGYIGDVAGDFDAAEGYYREALALRDALGDPDVLHPNTYNDMGVLAWRLGDYPAARQIWENALAFSEVRGAPPSLQLYPLGNLGNLMRQMGEYEAAHRYFEQASQIAQQMSDRRAETFIIHYRGQMAWDQNDNMTAASRWREAVALRDAMGITAFAHASRARLAEALVALGQVAEAREMAKAVWAAWQAEPPQAEDEDEVRQGYLALAHTFACLGEPETARACLEQAHAFVQERANRISDEAKRRSFLNVAVNREIATELVKEI